MRLFKNALHVATPIFYVNGAPHLGHLHSVTLADALHRAHKLIHPTSSSIFSTGTDEHGLKIQRAAEKASQSPRQFCDAVSSRYKELFDSCSVEYTDYIRTTEDRHKLAVSSFWTRLMNNGFIYKADYEGWYSTNDETFVTDNQIVEIKKGNEIIKVSSESLQPVEWTREENYMFALSRLDKDLSCWLDADCCVKPEKFAAILRSHISDGLPDLSISRLRSRLQWGIPVPHDDTQTIYVWVDALVNYLTVAGYPVNEPKTELFHVLGKDILKFHGVYWPALLLAAGLRPPKTILCHSHWTVDHEKMSKSKGNVVDPFKLVNKFGVDGVRYFLLREATPHSDANFSEAKMVRILNAELADTLGNLLSRCTAPNINKERVFPKYTPTKTVNKEDLEIAKQARTLCEDFPGLVFDGNIYRGLERLMDLLRKTNAYVQVKEPWTLARSPHLSDELRNVLYVALESVRVCATLLQPIVPSISDLILNKLALNGEERLWRSLDAFRALDGQTRSFEGRKLGTGSTVVFPRIRN